MLAKAVLFDLDGTLLNTLEDLADSVNAALATMGYAPRSLEEVRTFVGNGVRLLIRRALPPEADEQAVEQCLARFRDHYSHNMDHKTSPYTGIEALLEMLKRRGVRLAVVSNKYDAAVKQLCLSHFAPWVEAAIGERPGVEKKPAPDGALTALRELGVSSEGAVYVGDSDVDIATAHNAGLPCISVSWGFRSRQSLVEAGALRIADTPAQLAQMLLG